MNISISMTLMLNSLALLLGFTGYGFADPPAAHGHMAKELRTRLEKAVQSKSGLPKDLSVRVLSDMGATESLEKHRFREAWEFSSDRVYRLQANHQKDKLQYKRGESRECRSLNMVRELLDGGFFRLDNDGGKGERVCFANTGYQYGTRRISILVGSREVASVGETCTEAGMKESNARLFAALHETLACIARAEFEDHPRQKDLETALAQGRFLDGMNIEFGSDAGGAEDGTPTRRERWRLEPGKLHRIVVEQNDQGDVVERIDATVDFDHASVCRRLAERSVFSILGSANGPEDHDLLVGSPHQNGGRYMLVSVDGKEVLFLVEHCTVGGYGKTGSRNLGKIYETLAEPARAAFADRAK